MINYPTVAVLGLAVLGTVYAMFSFKHQFEENNTVAQHRYELRPLGLILVALVLLGIYFWSVTGSQIQSDGSSISRQEVREIQGGQPLRSPSIPFH